MMIQLDPPIPLMTPKGSGLAHLVTDYGTEFNLMWTVIIDDTAEIWTFLNPEVRGHKNITMGRIPSKVECNHEWMSSPSKYCWECMKCGEKDTQRGFQKIPDAD